MMFTALSIALSTLVSLAHAQDQVRYSVTDRSLEGEYSFYQEEVNDLGPAFGDDMSRAQLEMMVSDRLKKCADESDRCALMSLQWTAESGSFQLSLVMIDGDGKQDTIYLKLEEAKDGTLVGEKNYAYDKESLTSEARLSRIAVQIRPFTSKSGIVSPQIVIKTEAASKGSFGGLYLNKQSQLLMRQEDKEG